MIQRIQSVWLLLAGITVLCLLFVPMVTQNLGGTEYRVLASGIYEVKPGQDDNLKTFLPLLISTVLTAIVCFVNIFNYKKRLLQRRGVMICIVLLFGLSFWCSRYAQQVPGGLTSAKFGIGVFLPMIAILFCALAMRGISKDEKLIRSADRLR